MIRVFVTDDGYVFFYVGGEWVDSLAPGRLDMTFHGGPDGPVDSADELLGGELLSAGAAKTAVAEHVDENEEAQL